MRMVVRFRAWFAALPLGACGMAVPPDAYPNSAALPTGQAVVVAQKSAASGPSGTPNALPYSGSVLGLRSGTSLEVGAAITFSSVTVTANSGDGLNLWVGDASDPSGNAGMLVQRCAASDVTCQGNAPALGASVNVTGALALDPAKNQWSVSKAMVTVLATPLAPLLPQIVDPSQVWTMAKPSEALLGAYITLSSGSWTLANSYSDDLNANWSQVDPTTASSCETLNSASFSTISDSTLDCCPAGIGPKYGSFLLTDGTNDIRVSTMTWVEGSASASNLPLTAWLCRVSDTSQAVFAGNISGTFTVLGGIVDSLVASLN